MQVYTDEMALIASPEHPLTLKKPVSIQDLDGISLIVHRFCNWTEDTVLRLFRQHSLDYRVAVEVGSIESIKNMVLADMGIAVVPRIAVLQELRQKSLVQIFVPEFNLTLHSVMIFRRDHESELGRQLIEIMRNKLFVPRLGNRIA